MSWHVMVYSRGLESAYSHPYAVHLFTSSKPSPDEAFKVAGEILSKAFPDWGKDEREYLAFVGYEELPLSLPPEAEGMYVAAELHVSTQIKDVQLVSTVPPVFANVVEEYRMKKITLDKDEKSDYVKAVLLDNVAFLRERCADVKVYETRRGFHLRASLPEPLPLEKVMKVRKELGDDYFRLDIDEHYLRRGFGFLTNLLFCEKYWRDEPNGVLQRGVEVEVDPKEITVEYRRTLSFALPELSIDLPKGSIKVRGDTLTFKGCFGYSEMEKIAQSVEDNFWEYAFSGPREAGQGLKERVFKAYYRISPALAYVVEKCDLRVEGGKVVLHVPDELSSHVGRLIGKQGQNIRAVEAELGVRISISRSAPPPEDVEMKARLKELLRRVT